MEVDASRINIADAFKMYLTTCEIFAHLLEDQKRQNTRLKRKVEELESILTPKPLFSQPISTVKPIEMSPTLSLRIDKAYELLQNLREYVAQNV